MLFTDAFLPLNQHLELILSVEEKILIKNNVFNTESTDEIILNFLHDFSLNEKLGSGAQSVLS